MTEPHPRNLLHASYSFTSTSTSADPPRATLKRRYTESTQDPFRVAPPPPPQAYAHPNEFASTHQRPLPPNRSLPNVRNNATVVPPHPAMDPTPDEPGVVFIHPPFTDFPNAHLCKDGLTYNLMAANPEWFLDPKDYITTAGNDSESAIRYPTQLEPPRGWCPSKKRERKESWPEGEEPRLRCTFCRRTYAGVNAKSMWRRHVYEKHKIAMANRRDNNNTSERRVRGANKENKEGQRGSRRGESEETEQEATKDVPKQKQPEAASPKEGLSSRPELAPEAEQSFEMSAPNLSFVSSESAYEANFADEHDIFQVGTSSSTPPLTPGLSPFRHSGGSKVIPESPYNPLLTPSFKHSPARLPCEQPWKFPSPSHPLHTNAKELSLYMLVRGEASPVVSGLDVSPVVIVPKSERKKQSVFSSPLAPGGDDKDTISDGGEGSSKRRTQKPVKRRLFNDSALPTPFADRVKFQEYRVPESPLGRQFTNKPKDLMSIVLGGESWRLTSPLKTPAKSHGKTPSKLRSPGLLGPIDLDNEDPFVDMLSWSTPNGKRFMRPMSPPDSGSEADSPVIRSNHASQTEGGNSSFSSTDSFGLGVGLMEAFTLKDSELVKTPSSDDLMFVYDTKSKKDDKKKQYLPEFSLGSPPAQAGKKTSRRVFSGGDLYEGDSEMQETFQPKKRRRTVSGRD